MADTPIRDGITSVPVPDVPSETAGIGFTGTQHGDIGVQAGVNKDLGKPGGWSVTAVAEWWKKKGWSASGWLTWKGKDDA